MLRSRSVSTVCASPDYGEGAFLRSLWAAYNALRFVVAGLWCAAGPLVGSFLCRVTGKPDTALRVARRYWAPFLVNLAHAEVEVEGAEHVEPDRAQVLVCNHRSLFDIPLLIGGLPVGVRFVAKGELRRIPLLGRYLEATNAVLIDRDRRRAAIETVRSATDLLDQGAHVVAFPEGTRTRTGRLGRFKTGVFIPALEVGAPIVPVAIEGSDTILPMRPFGARPGKVVVRIGRPVDTSSLAVGDRRRVAREVHDRIEQMLSGESS